MITRSSLPDECPVSSTRLFLATIVITCATSGTTLPSLTTGANGRCCLVTPFSHPNEPLRLPTAPGLSLTGVRLVIPDHALGSPVLRSLSLCTCCRHYPGAAVGRTAALIHPTVSAFPERGVGSACASAFSRLSPLS